MVASDRSGVSVAHDLPGTGAVRTLTLNPALDNVVAAPRLVPGHKIRCGPGSFHPGGGGVNIARILTRFGEPATAVVPVGGHIGQVLVELLDDEGVATVTVPVAGETRQSYHVSDLSTGLEYELVLPGPRLDAAVLDRCLAALCAPGQVDYVVLSGSFPPGVPVGFVGEVEHVARHLGARLVVDTSGPALACVRDAYLVKPSIGELCELAGRRLSTDAEQAAAARELLAAAGAQAVLLSRGDRGSVLVTPEDTEPVAASRVPGDRLVSTVGAGDALVAGTIVGLRRGWTLSRAVLLGTRCGAAMVTTPGAAVFDPRSLGELAGPGQVGESSDRGDLVDR